MSQDPKVDNERPWNIFIEDKEIFLLINGGYSLVMITPGRYKFFGKGCWICKDTQIVLNIQANHVYYLEWYWDRPNMLPVFSLRTEAEALSGLSKTRYSPPKAYAVPGYQEEALKKKGK